MILNKPQASQIRVNSSIVLAADKVIYNTAGIKLTLKQGSVIKIIAVDDNEDQFEFIGKSNDVIDENNNHYASNYITGAIELVQGDFDFAEPGNSSDMRDGVAGMEEMLGSVVEAGDELTVLKYKDSDDYSDLDQAADNTIVEAPLDESNMFGDPVEGDEFYEEAAKKTANELNDKPEPPKMGKIPDRIHNPKEDIAGKKTAGEKEVSQQAKNEVIALLKSYKGKEIPDEKIHGIADKHGISPHDLESFVYGLASAQVSKKTADGDTSPDMDEWVGKKVEITDSGNFAIIEGAAYSIVLDPGDQLEIIGTQSGNWLQAKMVKDVGVEKDPGLSGQEIAPDDLYHNTKGMIIGLSLNFDQNKFKVISNKKKANVPDDSIIEGKYGDVYGTLQLKDGSTAAFNGEPDSYDKLLSIDPTAIASHGEDVYVEKKDGTKILLDSVGAVEDFIENNRTGSKKVQAYFQVGDMIKKIQDVDDKPKEVKKVYFDHASNTHMYDVATLGKITDAEIEQYTKVGKDETVNIWKPGKNKYDDPSKHGYEGEAQPKDLKKLPRKGSKRLSRKK